MTREVAPANRFSEDERTNDRTLLFFAETDGGRKQATIDQIKLNGGQLEEGEEKKKERKKERKKNRRRDRRTFGVVERERKELRETQTGNYRLTSVLFGSS